MPVAPHLMDGEEWQRFAHALLQRRFPPGDLVRVPDDHVGDFGIDFFTRSGLAFQCYAPDYHSTAQLHAKHRDKITKDVKKFIENRVDLAALFGNTVITRWILLVPEHVSVVVLQHATKKAEEVRNAGLPYASTDFCVHVEDESSYAAEKAALLNDGLRKIGVDPTDVDARDIEEWAGEGEHGNLIESLHGKMLRLRPGDAAEAALELQDRFMRCYLMGQEALASLRRDYPESWEAVRKRKRQREKVLEIQCRIPLGNSAETFHEQLKEYRQALSAGVPALSEALIEVLVYEAVADWLLRCPLDFPAGENANDPRASSIV